MLRPRPTPELPRNFFDRPPPVSSSSFFVSSLLTILCMRDDTPLSYPSAAAARCSSSSSSSQQRTNNNNTTTTVLFPTISIMLDGSPALEGLLDVDGVFVVGGAEPLVEVAVAFVDVVDGGAGIDAAPAGDGLLFLGVQLGDHAVQRGLRGRRRRFAVLDVVVVVVETRGEGLDAVLVGLFFALGGVVAETELRLSLRLDFLALLLARRVAGRREQVRLRRVEAVGVELLVPFSAALVALDAFGSGQAGFPLLFPFLRRQV
mmetsp:Transcript_27571/g.84578  ORF Transcript_27571/g.84578 Transcript_27571/m.84578 type:complete len:261 (-) Transcript_27571:728-1510(-)